MHRRFFICLVSAAVVAMAATASAQWADNFDTYGNGSTIIGQGSWVGWEQTGTDDTIVTNAQANSAPNSLQMGGQTAVDLVPQFNGVTSGIWTLDVMTYVPTGSDTGFSDIGYLSAHKGFMGAPSTQWNLGSTLNMASGLANNNATTPIIYDKWIQMHTVLDIDAKTFEIFYDGVLSRNGTIGADQALVGLDVWTPDGATTLYYDDFRLAPAVPEPGTLLLLATGALGLLLNARRKR